MAIDHPQDTHRLFAAAASRGALDSLVAFYEPDAIVVEQDGSLSQGTRAIRAHLEHLLALEPRMRIEASWTVMHGDVALLCSRWTAEIKTPDGRISTIESRGSEVVRRQRDGTWRLVIDNPWGIDVQATSSRPIGV